MCSTPSFAIIVGWIHLNFSWSKSFCSLYSLRPSSSSLFFLFTLFVFNVELLFCVDILWRGNERQVLWAMNNAVSVTQFYLVSIAVFSAFCFQTLGENEEFYKFQNFFVWKRLLWQRKLAPSANNKLCDFNVQMHKEWSFGPQIRKSTHFRMQWRNIVCQNSM